MTLQEIFQTSATRLLEQNRKSVSPDGACRYFMPDNTCCAVGLLFRDDLKIRSAIIREDLNGLSARNLLARLPEAREFFGIPREVDLSGDLQGLSQDTLNKIDLLWQMQSVHDLSDPAHWRGKLRQVGERLNLDISFLD